MNCNSLLQYWQSNGYVWKHVIFMCYYEYMLFGNRKMYLKKTNKREYGIFDKKQRVLLLHPCFFFHPFDWSLMDEVWQAILYDKKQVRENNIFISCFMVNNKGKKIMKTLTFISSSFMPSLKSDLCFPWWHQEILD